MWVLALPFNGRNLSVILFPPKGHPPPATIMLKIGFQCVHLGRAHSTFWPSFGIQGTVGCGEKMPNVKEGQNWKTELRWVLFNHFSDPYCVIATDQAKILVLLHSWREQELKRSVTPSVLCHFSPVLGQGWKGEGVAHQGPNSTLLLPVPEIWGRRCTSLIWLREHENQRGELVFRIYLWGLCHSRPFLSAFQGFMAVNPTGFESTWFSISSSLAASKKDSGMKAGKHGTMHEREKSPSLEGKCHSLSQNDFQISSDWFSLHQRFGRINFFFIFLFVFLEGISMPLFNTWPLGNASAAVLGNAS